MGRRDLISGIFWLILGLILSIWSTRYQIGTLIQPGPGFLALALGLLLILLSLILLCGEMKRSSFAFRETSLSHSEGHWRKVVYTVSVLILAAFFFEQMGYVITFFFLILLLMRGAGRQSWKRILLVAFLSTLGVYLVFVLLLEQPLPLGLLRL